jgi:hypothetical protein
MNLAEQKFGHNNGRKDPIDVRDYKWKNIAKARASAPFDWSVGFDVHDILRKILNNPTFRLTPYNQQQSYSCGGMAGAKYGEVLHIIFNGNFEAKSPKFIYSQIFQNGGGCYGRDICKLVINKGWGREADTPSTAPDGTCTEAFMERTGDITAQAFSDALLDEALSYATSEGNIDLIAQAIRDNYGCFIFVNGQDGNGWLGLTPNPPSKNNPNPIWQHWIYCYGAKMINGKKTILIINSWNGQAGDNGFQQLTEDYFNAILPNGANAIDTDYTLVYNATPRQIAGKPSNWLYDLLLSFIAAFK